MSASEAWALLRLACAEWSDCPPELWRGWQLEAQRCALRWQALSAQASRGPDVH